MQASSKRRRARRRGNADFDLRPPQDAAWCRPHATFPGWCRRRSSNSGGPLHDRPSLARCFSSTTAAASGVLLPPSRCALLLSIYYPHLALFHFPRLPAHLETLPARTNCSRSPHLPPVALQHQTRSHPVHLRVVPAGVRCRTSYIGEYPKSAPAPSPMCPSQPRHTLQALSIVLKQPGLLSLFEAVDLHQDAHAAMHSALFVIHIAGQAANTALHSCRSAACRIS